jgi:hypothetical protein
MLTTRRLDQLKRGFDNQEKRAIAAGYVVPGMSMDALGHAGRDREGDPFAPILRQESRNAIRSQLPGWLSRDIVVAHNIGRLRRCVECSLYWQ